jgi:ACS family allantoate permease-like MFS transporter
MIALNNCSFTTISKSRRCCIKTLITITDHLNLPVSVIGTNFAGATKKTTVNTMVFVAYCISNVVVPQAFLGREAPTYHTGILTVMCFQIALVVCYWTNWFLMTAENKRRDKVLKDQAPMNEDERRQGRIISGLQDMTDKENLAFRYAP